MNIISFKATATEHKLLKRIIARLQPHLANQPNPHQRAFWDYYLDLAACNANGCPLDFKKLLASSPFDFLHDIRGIAQHLNRCTGQLEDCFLPRCAKPQKTTK